MKPVIKFDSKNIFVFVFIACLFYSFWAVSVGWNNTLIGMHAFRQTQTAISTFYLIREGHWLAYQTPIFGIPWSIPFEFPLYQWIVAIIVKFFGTPLEQTGRFVSAVFFYLSLIPSYIILSCLDVPRHYRWVFLSLFLTSPMYLFWSRTFMIESTALFLGLAYLASVATYFRKKNITSISLASLFGMLGAAVKITTFTGFLLAAIILTLGKCYKNKQLRADSLFSLVIPLIAFVIIPYIAVSIWTNFADSQKLLNPISQYLTSKSLIRWNFGIWSQKLSLDVWLITLERITNDLWSYKTKVLLFLLLFMPFFGKRKKLFLICVFLFLVVILIFTNLHYVHNYYACGNAIFLIAAVGFGLLGLLEKPGLWKFLGCAAFALVISFQIQAYFLKWFTFASQNQTKFLETASIIKQQTNPQDIIVVYGVNWSSQLPYYSERRALMLPQNPSWMPQPTENDVKNVIENLSLSRNKLGALVICNIGKTNLILYSGIVENLINTHKFNKKIIQKSDNCEIHLPASANEQPNDQ